MTLTPDVILVRRQSPDWRGLSQDFRRGLPIDPARYVPSDETISGFPADLQSLIDRWNRRFKIDFFTFRAVIADLSLASVARIEGATSLHSDQLLELTALAKAGASYVYFHDDDDFFAPYLRSSLEIDTMAADALVTPMFRIWQTIQTVVRDGHAADYIWGERFTARRRYQTNNYGIHSRHCTSFDDIRDVKEHVFASGRADARGFTDLVLPTVLSATLKTPGSASALAGALADETQLDRVFSGFLQNLGNVDLPDRYAWIAEPIQAVARLTESVHRGDDYRALSPQMAV